MQSTGSKHGQNSEANSSPSSEVIELRNAIKCLKDIFLPSALFFILRSCDKHRPARASSCEQYCSIFEPRAEVDHLLLNQAHSVSKAKLSLGTRQKLSMADSPVIIGFAGKMGVGKDYAAKAFAKLIKPYQGTTISLAFADQLKVNVATHHRVDIADLLASNKSPETRKLLQQEGTERGRDKYGEDLWVRFIQNWIHVHAERFKAMGAPIKCVLITDCRFPNEAEWILSQPNGYLVHLKAPERNKAARQRSQGARTTLPPAPTDEPNETATHRSETSLDDFTPRAQHKARYTIINNDEASPGDNENYDLREKLIVSAYAFALSTYYRQGKKPSPKKIQDSSEPAVEKLATGGAAGGGVLAEGGEN